MFISLEERKKKRPSFAKCDKHHELKQLYCINCKAILCAICLVDNHDGHKSMSLYKFAEEKKKELLELLQNFNSDLAESLSDKDILLKERKETEESLEEVKRKIEDLLKVKENLEGGIAKKDQELVKFEKKSEEANMGLSLLQRMIEDMSIDDCLNEATSLGMMNNIKAGYAKIFPGKESLPLKFVVLTGNPVITDMQKPVICYEFKLTSSTTIRSFSPLPEKGSYLLDLNIISAEGCFGWLGFLISDSSLEPPSSSCPFYFLLIGEKKHENSQLYMGLKKDVFSFRSPSPPAYSNASASVISCPLGFAGKSYQFLFKTADSTLTFLQSNQILGTLILPKGRIWVSIGQWCCRSYQFTLSLKLQ